MNEQSDSQLIKSALKGSQESFRLIVLRYQQIVFAACYGICKNSSDAQDAAQETFIRFHKHIQQFDTSRSLKPWLLTIAMNCSRSLVKKAVINKKLKESAELEEACVKEMPGKELSRQEKHQAIREMVTQLPDSLREICSLFYLAQCTCKEIAGILNTSENSVKVGLYRARKKLLENGIGQWRSV